MAEPIELRILGRTLHAASAPAGLAAWLRRHWHFPEHDLPAHPYAIELECRSGRPPGPERDSVPLRLPAHAPPLRAARTGAGWRVSGEGADLHLSVSGSRARVAVRARSFEPVPPALHAALFLALCEAVRASGLMLLHAAVAARDGRATAFLGPSGTGKSTTLLRAVRSGWTPIAEDAAWLDPETLEVFGWDRGVRLHPAARERFAADRPARHWKPDADGKLLLPYARLGATAPRRATLARLAVLHRDDDGAPGWSRLAPRDAVRALWMAAGLSLTEEARRKTAAWISGLVPRLRAERLVIGSAAAPL